MRRTRVLSPKPQARTPRPAGGVGHTGRLNSSSAPHSIIAVPRAQGQESGLSLNLRTAVRAIILDEDDHVLLCRFVFPHPAVPNGAQAVWAAPGGGIEPGEDGLSALRRE